MVRESLAQRAVGALIVPMLIGTILLSIGILVFQTYIYLREGEWLSLSFMDGLRVAYVGWLVLTVGVEQLGKMSADEASVGRPFGQWLIEPQSWLGVHEILSSIPLALGVFGLGFGLFWILSKFFESMETRRLAQDSESRRAQQAGDEEGRP